MTLQLFCHCTNLRGVLNAKPTVGVWILTFGQNDNSKWRVEAGLS